MKKYMFTGIEARDMNKSFTKQNNKLKEQLSPENQQYYEELCAHLKGRDSKNADDLEEKLNQILNKILAAQKKQQSAQEALGQSPAALSKRLLMEKPALIQKSVSKFIFLFFLIFLQYNLFDHLLQPVIVIRFFNTVLPIVLLITATFLGLAAASASFSSRNRKKQYSLVILTLACWLGSIFSPLFDKQPLLAQQQIVSQQLFAGILLLITIALLVMQFHFKMSSGGIYITTFFAVLEGCILLQLINPILSATGIRILLWLVSFIILMFNFWKIAPIKNKI
jgi:cation transport ATPase